MPSALVQCLSFSRITSVMRRKWCICLPYQGELYIKLTSSPTVYRAKIVQCIRVLTNFSVSASTRETKQVFQAMTVWICNWEVSRSNVGWITWRPGWREFQRLIFRSFRGNLNISYDFLLLDLNCIVVYDINLRPFYDNSNLSVK